MSEFPEMQEMNLDDAEPKIIRVNIGKKRYYLREADEDAACKYRNAILSSTKFDAKGKPSGIQGMANAEPLLLSRCLYYPDAEGNPPVLNDGRMDQKALVPLSKIMFWSSRVVKPLFERIKEISNLSEAEKEGASKSLINALQRDDSPIPLKDFRDWVSTLEGEEYDSLKELVEETDEEKAKNLQSDTTNSSA